MRFTTVMSRRSGRLTSLGALLLAHAATASAQPQIALHPTFLSFSAGATDRTHLLRLSPGVTAGIDDPRGSIFGTYKFDAERYPGHGDLNALRGRERALLTARYRPTRHVAVSFDGGYDAYVRFPAARVSLMPSLRVEARPGTLAHATYHWIDQWVTGGVASNAHVGTVGIEQQVASRTTLLADYQRSYYRFAGDPTDSHAARLGFVQQMGRHNFLTIQAGPRITDGVMAPEGLVALTRELRREDSAITVAYVRTEAALIGLPGIVKADSVHARVAYRVSRPLVVTVSPTFFRGRRADLESELYGAGVKASYMILPSLYLDAEVGYDYQRGTLDLVPLLEGEYSRRIFALTVTKGWGNSGRPIVPPEAIETR